MAAAPSEAGFCCYNFGVFLHFVCIFIYFSSHNFWLRRSRAQGLPARFRLFFVAISKRYFFRFCDIDTQFIAFYFLVQCASFSASFDPIELWGGMKNRINFLYRWSHHISTPWEVSYFVFCHYMEIYYKI